MELSLNPQQQRAVHAPLRPLLIVAGAGTGKTKTLMGRFAYLLESGIPPHEICAITFTNKAAEEMASRVGHHYGHRHRQGESFIGTFHSLGAKILRSEASLLRRTKNFVIFDDRDSRDLIKKIVKSLELKKSEAAPAHFERKISDVKSGTASLTAIQKLGDERSELFLKVFDLYERGLRDHNALDFDDLIEKAVWLFSRYPDIVEKYQKKFPHILIDEYQDVNAMQYVFVKLLARRAASLSVVGDDAQMIYGWRGSAIEVFLNFENDWPNAYTVVLEENYRSTGHIITAASAMIKNNVYQWRGRYVKNLWTKNPLGSPLRLTEVPDEEGESEWIVDQISKPQILNSKESVAILYRTNAQSRALEDALIRHEIPYEIFGGVKFYERREIRDIVSALRIAENPKDFISRERLLKNLGKMRFLRLEERLVEGREDSPSKLIALFLDATDYREYLRKNFINAEEREENIVSLLRFAHDFDAASPFLERIALLQDTDSVARKSGGRRAVSLMTIHLAKGLEFDRAFLAGVSEGLLPHAKSLASRDGLEEERRLMYVAMTRARKELAIVFYGIPSRFISEFPPENYEFLSLASDHPRILDDEERYITLD